MGNRAKRYSLAQLECTSPLAERDDPDTSVVLRIANGDQSAVRELVGRHLPALHAVARRMMGSAEEAEDVVQEVFLKVWTHAGKWQPGRAKFSTWLHRVAINQCYDRLRRKREIAMDKPPEHVDSRPSPEEMAMSSDLSKEVYAALQELPERQRAALVLSHYQGFSQMEAAAVLEVTEEALESLLARGRRTLRTRLAGLAAEHAIGRAAQ